MNLKSAKIIISLAILFGLTSCFSDDETSSSTQQQKDALIYAFSLSNSDIPELANISFTIDHKNEEIYNIDSLTYGTKVSSVLLSITSNAAYIEAMAEATNDTVYWASSDSIDFSKPVKLKVYSYDGSVQKTYTARLNIHQQNGSDFTWKMLTNKATNKTISNQKTILFSDAFFSYVKVGNEVLLYVSVDGGNIWLPQSMKDFPSEPDLSNMLVFDNAINVTTASGKIFQSSIDGKNWFEKASYIDGEVAVVKTLLGIRGVTMNGILEKSGVLYYGTSTDMNTWTISDDPIAPNFPVKGFGAASNNIGLILVSGIDKNDERLNTTWLTAHDRVWIQTVDEKINALKKVEGPALVHYANKYYLIGGKDASGKCMEDIYVSATNGVTWTKANSLTITDYYTPRAYASVLVVNDELMLFGGISEANSWLDDVWSGFLNEIKF